MAVGAKTENPEVGQASPSFLKSKSGGKLSSLIDQHCNGLRLRLCKSFGIKLFY